MNRILCKLKYIIKPLLPIALTIIGVMAIVDGEVDDSPGEMLLGLLIVMYSAYFNFKNFNTISSEKDN